MSNTDSLSGVIKLDCLVMEADQYESATRERTRQAILAAGIATWTEQPGASIGEIADAAGVARSTLHRYYPDRAALRAGIAAHVASEYEAALDRSRPDEGTGMEAFTRLVGELLDHLHVFTWWMYPENYTDTGEGSAFDPGGRTEKVIARGHADDTIDPTMPTDWLIAMIWSALYSVDQAPPAPDGQARRTPREARELALRSLVKLAQTVHARTGPG